MKRILVLGQPGTGKTTTLIGYVESLLQRGVHPTEIAYCSFTRKSAEEAVERACKKFGMKRGQFPYFRTLHSLAYRSLGLTDSFLMRREHYKEIFDAMGVEYADRGAPHDDEPPIERDEGSACLFLDGLARSTRKPLYDVWCDAISIYSNKNLDWELVKDAAERLAAFKYQNSLLDYTDMLERFVERRIALPVKFAFIDEAQDLSGLQFDMVETAFQKAQGVCFAGDDDQAIHTWAGADVDRFLRLPIDDRRVLTTGWRVPSKIHDFAVGISSMISNRYTKSFVPKHDGGVLEYYGDVSDVPVNNGETWFLLARNSFLLPNLRKAAEDAGVYYSYLGCPSVNKMHWRAIVAFGILQKGGQVGHDDVEAIAECLGANIVPNLPHDRQYSILDLHAYGIDFPIKERWSTAFLKIHPERRSYYWNLMARGVNIDEAPPVQISTIHGVKGGEADNVLLLPDISAATARGYREAPDGEHRVFYVGATRARKGLHIVDRGCYGKNVYDGLLN